MLLKAKILHQVTTCNMNSNLIDASQLDTWVFEQVNELFERSKHNQTLYDQLHSDKIVFFLHLLGIDTNGHAYRPESAEYYNNIRIVDEGVHKMYQCNIQWIVHLTFSDSRLLSRQ